MTAIVHSCFILIFLLPAGGRNGRHAPWNTGARWEFAKYGQISGFIRRSSLMKRYSFTGGFTKIATAMAKRASLLPTSKE